MQEDHDRLLSAQTLAVEGLYGFLKDCHRTAARERQDGKTYNGDLPPKVAKKIQGFIDRNNLLQPSCRLMEAVVLLEMTADGLVTDGAVIDALMQLQKELTKDSAWELLGPQGQKDSNTVLLLSSLELEKLDAAAASYITLCFSKMPTRDTNAHFPLTDESLRILSWTYRILRMLCAVPIYEFCLFQMDATLYLNERIQLAVNLWMEENLQLTRTQDSVLQDISALCDLLSKVKLLLVSCRETSARFPVKSRDFAYLRSLAAAVDSALSPVCEATLAEVDKYNEKHQQFHANMMSSSGKCCEMYLLVRDVANILADYADRCDIAPRLMDHPQWFEKVFFILIETSCMESRQRVQRAVQLDSMDTRDSGNQKVTTSAVDVSSCFLKVASEWKELSVPDSLQVPFLVRITTEVCDDCILYGQLMEAAAKDAPLSQLCLIANNVDKVRQHVQQLPEILRWDTVRDSDAQKSLMLRILQNADADTCQMRDDVLEQAAEMVMRDAEEQLLRWVDTRNQDKTAHGVLDVLDSSVGTLHSELVTTLFPRAVTAVWRLIVDHVASGFQEGMAPEHAQPVLQNLDAVEQYLRERWEVEPDRSTSVEETVRFLRLHTVATSQLQLEYYSDLAEQKEPSPENIGNLAFRVGFRRVDKDCVTLCVQVVKGQKLGMTKTDVKDLSLTVQLGPTPMFPTMGPQKIRRRRREPNPSFHEAFEFPSLPSNVLEIKGASLLLWLRTASFSGEVIFPLTSAQDIGRLTSIDFLPVSVQPLRQFPATFIYQVLKQRSKWDRSAEQFITLRRKIGSHRSIIDSNSLTRNLKSAFHTLTH